MTVRSTTIDAVGPAAALETLRDAFRAHTAALIARYPGQARNAAYYAAQADAARLGVMARKVSTKGGNVYPRGAAVLVLDAGSGIPGLSDTVTVWADGRSCPTVCGRRDVQF